MRIKARMGMSIDGYVATTEGMPALVKASDVVPGQSHDYPEFIAGCDAVAIGRQTFLPALGAPSWPWEDMTVYVLTSRPLPTGTPESVITSTASTAGLERRNAMTSTTTRPMPQELVPRIRAGRVWRGAILAAAAAMAAVELYVAAARAVGVPMKAGFLGAAAASPLTAASFATGVLVCTFWGAVLAVILAKKAAHPARTFVTIAAALTALSLAVPADAGATAPATKMALAAAHILVAGIVIPIIARHVRPAAGPRPEDPSLPAECVP